MQHLGLQSVASRKREGFSPSSFMPKCHPPLPSNTLLLCYLPKPCPGVIQYSTSAKGERRTPAFMFLHILGLSHHTNSLVAPNLALEALLIPTVLMQYVSRCGAWNSFASPQLLLLSKAGVITLAGEKLAHNSLECVFNIYSMSLVVSLVSPVLCQPCKLLSALYGILRTCRAGFPGALRVDLILLPDAIFTDDSGSRVRPMPRTLENAACVKQAGAAQTSAHSPASSLSLDNGKVFQFLWLTPTKC